jgi:transcriptional regulator with XRE-family HTH domain
VFIYIIQLVGVTRRIVIGLALIVITGRHIRAARALLGWSQEELSRKSKVALGTIRRMEGFDGAIGSRTDTLALVVATLEKAGIEFLDGGSPGVRLKAK